MKNIHLIPTPNPSRLLKTIPKGNLLLAKENIVGSHWENQNIYITSDDEIKERDWCIVNGKPEQILEIQQAENVNYKTKTAWFTNCKKIILTTDQDLIKDGVQAIDDEFLEWFVHNSSCEEVKVEEIDSKIPKKEVDGYFSNETLLGYKIIIPKEEPKQIKCYCGHTTYCDCSPLEEPKQETTFEEAVEKLSKTAYKKHSVKDDKLSLDEQIQRSGGFIVGFKEGMIEGAKWQAERMYSEEEVILLIAESICKFKLGKLHDEEQIIESLEQFKKK